MKNTPNLFSRLHRVGAGGLLAALLLPASASFAAAPSASFLVQFSGSKNVPTVKVTNNSRERITKFEMTIGNTDKNFHMNDSEILSTPSGITASFSPTSGRVNKLTVNITGFDYGEYFTFKMDIDKDSSNSGEDYRRVLFNNDTGGVDNSIITVTTASGKKEELKLKDVSNTGLKKYEFGSDSQPRVLTVSSSAGFRTDGTRNYIESCNVRVNDTVFATQVGSPETIKVYDGETVEITAPQIVYHDEDDDYLTDSSNLDSTELVKSMQRYVAIGISVNNIPQSGDPTLYRFTVDDAEKVVEVKWRHDYALRIEQEWTGTASPLKDQEGLRPWAGPVNSDATGDPTPDVNLHWIATGESVVASIGGQEIDQTRPGLDVRFVPASYSAAGSAGDLPSINETNRYPFTVGQSPPNRQLVGPFTMDGPGLIKYHWQIQYGVRVNIDDVARNDLPLVVQRDDLGVDVRRFYGDGVFWFDPGTKVDVLSAVSDDASDMKALAGWTNGDGYYFKTSGSVHTPNGALDEGQPDQCDWQTYQVVSNITYHGMSIDVQGGLPGLQRPVRVLWSYGNQAIATTVPIGEFIFQQPVINNGRTFSGDTFNFPPDTVLAIDITGANPNVPEAEMYMWDEEAARLYPLVPGLFRVTWSNETEVLDVLVTAEYPEQPHYKHIAGTPPVNLEPDPAAGFVFKELRYAEGDAVIDDNKNFLAEEPGWSVLLFGERQQVGRGEPREYLRVRTVQTLRWEDRLSPDLTKIIGQAVHDPQLDKANLGTGAVLSNTARYNPFVYNADLLTGLAAPMLYDMAALKSTEARKVVLHPENLPGPIIPVNLHPQARADERLVVAWYDDPALNDGLLWPHAARTYLPRWPRNASEGLGRIVIASQFGSESLGADLADQEVVGEASTVTAQADGTLVTNVAPAEVTYNPTRLQQVSVYSQPDAGAPGYNPNEEHGLIAPSLRHAQVSPRPPAIYALRDDDLNRYTRGRTGESGQPGDYTSHPYVLVQFFDAVEQVFKMRVYDVVKEVSTIKGYSFADATLWDGSVPEAYRLFQQPHVVMEAGEPVIPFYPLGVVIGAVVPPETFGFNITSQITYWEDHKATSWSVSGGPEAWFSQSPYYPLQPDFWWPEDEPGTIMVGENKTKQAFTPSVGSSLAFLPPDVDVLRALQDGDAVSTDDETDSVPTEILYKSDWPDVVPILKAGETLTFSGGEHRADKPTSQRIDENGELETVETPGLPGVVAFASAEVVFDTRNPTGADAKTKTHWTARVAQVLEKRTVELAFGDFPPALAPASGRTRISSGKYVFNELPASLQKRFRYDPINTKIEIFGYLNDKDIADDTLTASPPAVYVLEPNILTATDLDALNELDDSAFWRQAVRKLYEVSRNPHGLETASGEFINDEYLVGLEPKVIRDDVTQEPLLERVEEGSDVMQMQRDEVTPASYRGFGPGLAVVPNAGFLDPAGGLPEISYITVVENNDPTLGGSPITPHVIKIDRRKRYRGSIKTVLSDNVFDENVVLRHQGDFGANADELYFEWYYRPDDGSLNVPPPDQISPSQTNPWKLFPDLSGEQGRARYEVTLKGNPNAPEALLADTWWFVRYRHNLDNVQGTDWAVPQVDGTDEVNFTWAGAGNSDPLGTYTGGIADYKAQLVMGWIKRVLDAVNPYEARIRDFEGDSPSTAIGMLRQLGARYEGPVALNPAKNVIENVGLIELYETILKRGRDLSIDLSRPVSTPAIANALQLAATRISDFYMLLANEAYVDALDPTIGHGSESAAYGHLAPAVFTFQNQQSSLIEEELSLLRGVFDNYARPVYNRLFWNFTKGEGEAAYAVNYNVWDVNGDGFVDEDDAMILYPQGHGDAWGHYLTAVRNQYDLLKHKYFNWVSRSEFYNLMDIVIKVDFLDERKFAQMAAAKAKAGAEIVDLSYREKYVEDPTAQWQGYTDSDRFRAWGVQGWARRAGQGAYFDWVTANALLPSKHPNQELEGIQKVDRQSNADIAVVSANLNRIQRTFDDANNGYNPLGVARDAVPMDIDPQYIGFGRTDLSTHFGQIYDRASKALNNAKATWDHANTAANMLRKIGTTEADFRNKTFQGDLSYQNKLIALFGKPYEGTIGSGRLYPAGYDGPDLALHMYVDVRGINDDTVPGPTTTFAKFDENGDLEDGDMFDAFNTDKYGKRLLSLDSDWRTFYAPSFATANGEIPAQVQSGLYSVEYTNLDQPKVPLKGLTDLMPVTTSGYTFQAPDVWGNRLATGKLQTQLQAMLIQEAKVASAIADWDGLSGEIIRTLRVMDAKILTGSNITLKNEIYSRLKKGLMGTIKGIEGIRAIKKTLGKTVKFTAEFAEDAIPENMPTGGFAVSPGDALAPARAGVSFASKTTEITLTSFDTVLAMAKLVAETSIEIADNETDLWVAREGGKQNKREWLKSLEDMVGDEPVKRIAVFREIETLRSMSNQYRALVDQGARLIDERAAYNKRVAALTQRNRYQDMTFRVARNHALENYRAAFELAAQYAYLAAKAYDYETNFDPSDPFSAQSVMQDIVKARGIGLVSSGPKVGGGGLAEAMATLKTNFDNLYGQLGLSNPQEEVGKISLRTELFRILPKGQTQPDTGDSFPSPGGNADELWKQVLTSSVVEDLWDVPEFRRYCRPFTSEPGDDNQREPQPGIVLRFGTTVKAGENFFGKPLSGSDHAYDPTVYATKILGAGIWFSDYQSDDVLQDLPDAPRIYLVPAGADIMSVANSPDPNVVRIWNILDQSIPAPIPAVGSELDRSAWMPLYDTLSGQYGEARRFSSFRAYHNGDAEVKTGEMVYSNRLIGRSVRNTQWVMIIPGLTLNADPGEGLRRFIEQVSDINLVFETYGYSGN